MVAGTLPAASRATSIQSTVRAAAWTIVPVALVEAANSKSVPTAVVGLTPKHEDEQWRQQRAAAYAGHADQRADAKTRYSVKEIWRNKMVHGAPDLPLTHVHSRTSP